MNTNFSTQSHRWLVVDDEPELSELIALGLAAIATEPVENYTSSPAALARLAAEPLGFDLLITDRDMPQLDGIELARRVHAAAPGVKVILVSANVDDLSREDLDRAGISGVVQKPFTLQSLQAAARPYMALPQAAHLPSTMQHAA